MKNKLLAISYFSQLEENTHLIPLRNDGFGVKHGVGVAGTEVGWGWGCAVGWGVYTCQGRVLRG